MHLFPLLFPLQEMRGQFMLRVRSRCLWCKASSAVYEEGFLCFVLLRWWIENTCHTVTHVVLLSHLWPISCQLSHHPQQAWAPCVPALPNKRQLSSPTILEEPIPRPQQRSGLQKLNAYTCLALPCCPFILPRQCFVSFVQTCMSFVRGHCHSWLPMISPVLVYYLTIMQVKRGGHRSFWLPYVIIVLYCIKMILKMKLLDNLFSFILFAIRVWIVISSQLCALKYLGHYLKPYLSLGFPHSPCFGGL